MMTVQEVADLLRVSERAVCDWATSGQIPCGKLGTVWRFGRSEIDNWIDKSLAMKKKTNPASIISLRDITAGGPPHTEHVKILARVSGLIKGADFRGASKHARDAAHAFDLLVGNGG